MLRDNEEKTTEEGNVFHISFLGELPEATSQDISQEVKALSQMGLPIGQLPQHTSKIVSIRSG
jgi:hypothetical protein